MPWRNTRSSGEKRSRISARANDVAYFNKQLGRKPTRNGLRIRLSHPHGGDWGEWEPTLRIRQFPSYFNSFRKG